MKKLAFVLALCLLLGLVSCAAPAEQPVPPVEPPEPVEAPEALEIPDESEVPAEPGPTPESDPQPKEEPQPEEGPGPAAYVYTEENRTVVLDGSGRVVFTLKEQLDVDLLRDERTGAPWVAAVRPSAYDVRAIYDLEGNLLREEPLEGYLHRWGNLVLVQTMTGTALYDVRDGTELPYQLRNVAALGDYILAEPLFKSGAMLLLDENGEVVKELDSGFRISMVHETPWGDFAEISAPDHTRTLIDSQGNMCLYRFYDEILGFSTGCAIVRDGEENVAVLTGQAVSMTEAVRTSHQILGVTPQGAAVDTGDGAFYVGRKGEALCSLGFEDLKILFDEKGNPTGLEGLLLDSEGSKWAVYLNLDGTERFRIRYTWQEPVSVDGKTALCLSFSGEGEQPKDRRLALVDLTTGDVTWLEPTGVQAITILSTRWDETLLFRCAKDNGKDDILAADGTVLLRNVVYEDYQGGGVLQCAQGDAKGLLRTDGTWLYRAE